MQLKLAHEGNTVEWWDLGAKLVDTLSDDEDFYGSGDSYFGEGVEGSGCADDDEGSGCCADSEGSGDCDDEDEDLTTPTEAPETTSPETTTEDAIVIDVPRSNGTAADGAGGGEEGIDSGATEVAGRSLLLPLLAALWLAAAR